MPVLITGAGGMVGSHMMEYFYHRGQSAVGTYYHPTTDITELPEGVLLIPCDIRDHARVEELITEYQPERIFHLAAQSFPTVSLSRSVKGNWVWVLPIWTVSVGDWSMGMII